MFTGPLPPIIYTRTASSRFPTSPSAATRRALQHTLKPPPLICGTAPRESAFPRRSSAHRRAKALSRAGDWSATAGSARFCARQRRGEHCAHAATTAACTRITARALEGSFQPRCAASTLDPWGGAGSKHVPPRATTHPACRPAPRSKLPGSSTRAGATAARVAKRKPAGSRTSGAAGVRAAQRARCSSRRGWRARARLRRVWGSAGEPTMGAAAGGSLSRAAGTPGAAQPAKPSSAAYSAAAAGAPAQPPSSSARAGAGRP